MQKPLLVCPILNCLLGLFVSKYYKRMKKQFLKNCKKKIFNHQKIIGDEVIVHLSLHYFCYS